MKLVQRSAAILIIWVLASCANLPTPDTFNQKLAVALGTVTAVRTTTTTLLQARKISADDAQNVQDAANNARAGIEVARTLSKVSIAAADSKLSAVTTALQALQTYLTSKGA